MQDRAARFAPGPRRTGMARRLSRVDLGVIGNPGGRGGLAGSGALRYGLAALVGFAAGVMIFRSRRSRRGPEVSFGGIQSREAGTSGAERWGSGVTVGESPARTGAGRSYSEPSEGPLVGEERRPRTEVATGRDESIEQRIRTQIGEDPRTATMARVNVEVDEGVAELRGEAPSENARQAAGEIAASTEGVREVRNLITVNPEAPTRQKGGEESDRSS
ncbi:BON domain-containing protein [Rubrobacter naiadicus]|uniref:BON domain-containing protein n=1 Tax=Rubrobacter naiadicus TaxID=1392641 RepID=UPI002361F743|nr:BON domain-containing protein [Rubrobacter naiadicus]